MCLTVTKVGLIFLLLIYKDFLLKQNTFKVAFDVKSSRLNDTVCLFSELSQRISFCAHIQ